MNPKPYPSDLTDQQWAILKPFLPPARTGGRPRKTDMRSVVNAIFYRNGTDQGFGVSLEHEDGDTRGGRGRCWEMSAYTSAARHAAKCAESGRTRNVA